MDGLVISSELWAFSGGSWQQLASPVCTVETLPGKQLVGLEPATSHTVVECFNHLVAHKRFMYT